MKKHMVPNVTLVARDYAGNDFAGIMLFVVDIGARLQRVSDCIETAVPCIVVQHHVQLVLTRPSVELLVGLDYVIHDDNDK